MLPLQSAAVEVLTRGKAIIKIWIKLSKANNHLCKYYKQ